MIDINDLTIGQARELSGMFGAAQPQTAPLDNHMLGKYVIVRCHDAGVHCGVLESYIDRQCVLTESRRLWRWKPKTGKWLSAVANNGVDSEYSKISETVSRIHLTENCELILCTNLAEQSLREIAPDA